MTKHLILHSCGHEAERDLHGNAGSRDWQAEQWTNKPCPVCWRADVTSASAEATLFAEAHGWPDLEGSERQTVWAVAVRAELVDSLPSRMNELVMMAGERGQLFADTAGAIVLARQIALEYTSAAWWIEHRGTLATALTDPVDVRRRLAGAGDTGKTARALLIWAGAGMAS